MARLANAREMLRFHRGAGLRGSCGRGFTLIELLVVVAIIALLLAIMLPSLSRAKKQARKVVCGSHMHDLANAMLMYAHEQKGWLHEAPNHGFWDNAWQRTKLNDPTIPVEMYDIDDGFAYWGIAYFKYAKNRDIWACPSQVRVDDWPEQDFGPAYQPYFQHCSYGLNGIVAVSDNAHIERKFPQPSEVIFFQDHIEQRMDSFNEDMLCMSRETGKNLPQWTTGKWKEEFPEARNECFRHLKKCNTTWLDGHLTDIRFTLGEDVPFQWYYGRGTTLYELWDISGGH